MTEMPAIAAIEGLPDGSPSPSNEIAMVIREALPGLSEAPQGEPPILIDNPDN